MLWAQSDAQSNTSTYRTLSFVSNSSTCKLISGLNHYTLMLDRGCWDIRVQRYFPSSLKEKNSSAQRLLKKSKWIKNENEYTNVMGTPRQQNTSLKKKWNAFAVRIVYTIRPNVLKLPRFRGLTIVMSNALLDNNNGDHDENARNNSQSERKSFCKWFLTSSAVKNNNRCEEKVAAWNLGAGRCERVQISRSHYHRDACFYFTSPCTRPTKRRRKDFSYWRTYSPNAQPRHLMGDLVEREWAPETISRSVQVWLSHRAALYHLEAPIYKIMNFCQHNPYRTLPHDGQIKWTGTF